MRPFPSVRSLMLLLFLSFPLPAIPQEGRVVLVNTDSRELKRTAQRLHIPIERLKNARQALQEATELAGRARPIEPHHFYQIGEFWIQFHRVKAEASTRSLFSALRSAAMGAEGPEYTAATHAAQALLSSLAPLDPELPLQLARTWPQAPEQPGPNGQDQTSLEPWVRRTAAANLVHSNPEAALNILASAEQSGPGTAALRGALATRMIDAGRTQEGMKLLDEALADLAASGDILPSLGQFSDLLQQLSRVAPDRFLEAYRILASNPAGAAASQGHGFLLSTPDGQITLSPNEAIAFNALRGISQQPELMLKALDTMPGLKSKVEQAGGIDQALHQQSGFRYTNPDGSRFAGPPEPHRPTDPQKLFSELRGKAVKNATLVRSRLKDEITGSENPEWLLQLAQMSSWEDPDLAGIALEIASPLIAGIEPVERHISMLQSLIRTTRQCEGEVDPELIRDAFILVDELRQNEIDGSADGHKQAGRVPADYFEAFLISELSRDDFVSAIRYVRSIRDESLKLTALLQIVQACANPY